jgi:SAM-dependent methyltransferase
MQLRELTAMYEVETGHWWFAGKRILFKRLLRERLSASGLRILDIGCGTGAVAVDFSRYGWVCAADRSIDALAFVRSRGATTVAASDAAILPFRSQSFDLVLAFDIIEHVDDDAAMVAELARVLKPGGAVAIHVPAWPSLWSRHDEVLEHRRRYTRRSLASLLERSPLSIEYLGWSSATIFLPAVAMRWARRLVPARNGSDLPAAGDDETADIFSLPGPLNAALRSVYRAEASLAASIGLPFGLSLAAIAVR